MTDEKAAVFFFGIFGIMCVIAMGTYFILNSFR